MVLAARPWTAWPWKGVLLGNTRDTGAAVAATDRLHGAGGGTLPASALNRFWPPQIHSPDGKPIFGPEMVARAYVQQYGVVGYSRTAAQARQDARVGNRPLSRPGQTNRLLRPGSPDGGRRRYRPIESDFRGIRASGPGGGWSSSWAEANRPGRAQNQSLAAAAVKKRAQKLRQHIGQNRKADLLALAGHE